MMIFKMINNKDINDNYNINTFFYIEISMCSVALYNTLKLS